MFQQIALMAPFFISLFWAIVFIINRSNNSRSQNAWIFCSLLAAAFSLIWAIYLPGVTNYHLFYKIEIAESFVLLSYSACLFFFFRALIDERPFGWIEFFWFLPPMLIGGITTGLFLYIGEEQSAAFSQAVNERGSLAAFTSPMYRVLQFVYFDLLNWTLRVQIVVVLVYATVRLLRYRHRLAQFFSDLDGKSLENQRDILIGIYAEIALLAALSVGRLYYRNHPDMATALLLALTAITFFLSFQVYNMKYSVEDFAEEEKEADRQEQAEEANSTPNEDPAVKEANKRRYNDLADDFERIIVDKQLFLQPDLRVSDVAKLLNTNRTYISALMSEKFNCTFSYYVNARRIEYAKQLIKEKPYLALEQVSEQSGFVYVTSFCRIFKEYTGMTVRAWQHKR